MNKRLFLVVLFLIALPLVNAYISSSNLSVFVPFNETSGTIAYDWINGDNNFTQATGTCTATSTGRYNLVPNCYMQGTYTSEFDITGSNAWTFAIDFNWSSGTSAGAMSMNDAAAYDTFLPAFNDGAGISTYGSTTGSSWSPISNKGVMSAVTNNVWRCLIIDFNGTHYKWQNETAQYDILASTTKLLNFTQPRIFRAQRNNNFKGGVRNLLFAKNRLLTSAEKVDWCTNHTYVTPIINNNLFAFNGSSIPEANHSFAQDYMNFSQNATITNNSMNCSLFINNAFNESKFYENLTNQSYFFAITYDKTFSIPGEYNYSISCLSNITNTTYNTSRAVFYLDSVVPQMTTTFVNRSIYFNNNITANFSFTDDFWLHSFNITIDGTNVVGNSSLSGKSFNYTFSRIVTDLSNASHILGVRYADGHTANEISDYQVSTGLFGNKLEYSWNDGGVDKKVTIQNSDINFFDKFSTEKKKDRYVWTFEPSTLKNSYTFQIDADDDIEIVNAPGTYLKSWIVFGNKWMDFDLYGENTNIEITKSNKNKVFVTVSNILAPQKQKYQSIGDLNIVQQNFTFYKIGASVQYTNNLPEDSTNDFYLNITNLSLSGINTSMLWSNNPYSSNYLSSTASIIRFNSSFFANVSGLVNWTYLFTVNGTSFNVTGNQTINALSLTNCTGGGNKTINYLFFSEATTTPAIVNVTQTISYWSTDISNVKSFNLTLTSVTNYTLCFNPNTTFFMDSNLIYTFGALSRSRIDNNYSVLSTQNITLYTSTNVNRIYIKFIDQLNNPLVNVYVNMYLNGLFIDSDTVDTNGYTSFDYDTTMKYSFKVFDIDSGDLLHTTNALTMYPNPMTIKLGSTTGSQLETNLNLKSLSYSLIMYNATKIVNFTWNNNAGYTNDFCLKVINSDDSGTARIVNNECTPSSVYPNSLVYNASALNGTIYVSAYAKGSQYVIDTFIFYMLSAGTKLYQVMGLDAYLWQVFLILIFGFAFAYINPALIFLGIDAALIFGTIITLIPLSWAALVSVTVISIVAFVKLNS